MALVPMFTVDALTPLSVANDDRNVETADASRSRGLLAAMEHLEAPDPAKVYAEAVRSL